MAHGDPKRPHYKSVRVELTTTDVAKILGLSVHTIRKYMNQGKIGFTKDRRRNFFILLDLLAERKITPTIPPDKGEDDSFEVAALPQLSFSDRFESITP